MRYINLLIALILTTAANAQLRLGGTGSVNVVYSTSPTLVTPTLGVATATTLNGNTFTTGTYTLTGTSGKTLNFTKSLILDGTDGTTMTFPTSSKTVAANDGSNWTLAGQAAGDLSTATSSTAYGKIAAVAAGQFLTSNGTGATPVYLNTRQNWTSFVVSGSNATTTGQSLTDVTGLTSGTLAASTLYEVEAWLNVTTSAVTTGCQYAIGTTGTGSASIVMALLIGNSTGTTMTMENLTGAGGTASTARLLTSAQSGMIYIHGWVTTRSTGTPNISIQHLKVTSGTSTVLIGSLFRYRLAN
jgi:hypothetical protein